VSTYQHVTFAWDDAHAASIDAVERLVYRSNLLGSDQRITNTGGGNTSSKLTEKDPLTGQDVPVLWVKGSGGDLRTSNRSNFSSLYQQKLVDLQGLYAARADKGLKSAAEDEMVGMYSHTTFNLNPRPSSIDTPLHSFIPAPFVDHMHPNAVIAIAASQNCAQLTQEIFGGEMGYVPWMRPGFELGLAMQEICATKPNVKSIMMGQHGFISWDDEEKACYTYTLDCIEKAAIYIETKYKANGGDATVFGGAKYHPLDVATRARNFAAILPWLRGQVSQQQRFIGTVQDDEKILRFVNSTDAPRLAELGTSCPDHFLRTKIKPLYIDWNPQTEDLAALKAKLAAGITQYRLDYAAYYNKCQHANSPAMRDPNPTVVLIPGLGMIAWGKSKSESRVTAEFYNCAVEVMRGAEAIDTYIALPQQEAFDIEYWLLEEAKLQRMPAEAELARQTVIIVGAGSGIGKETAHRIAKEGANVVCVDLKLETAQATAEEITAKLGQGIGHLWMRSRHRSRLQRD
jgi:rhamnulose-1-phosphate aldolase/alcohol dehydrogenase